VNSEGKSLPAELVANKRNVGVTNPAILPFTTRIRSAAACDPLVELRRLEIHDDAALGKTRASTPPITKELVALPQARMILVVLRICLPAWPYEREQNGKRTSAPTILENAHLNSPSAPNSQYEQFSRCLN
jgi:hypothetical protein